MLKYNIDNVPLHILNDENVRLDNNISFEGLLYEAEKIKENSTDFIIDKKKIKSLANEKGFIFSIENKKYWVSNWAIHYVCTTHGIPKSYINKIMYLASERNHKPLIALTNDTINTFLNTPTRKISISTKKGSHLGDNSGSEYLIRVINKNYIRAIRSSNFKIKDNYPLLFDIKDTVMKYYVLSSGVVNYNVLILRMFLKERYVYSKKNIKIGVQLKNSETGHYALQLQILISIDGFEFSSNSILNMRHSAKAISNVDVNKDIISVAEDYKESIFSSVKDIIKDNKLNEQYYSDVLPELRVYLNKDDYSLIEKFSRKSNKISISKKILKTVSDYDFVRKEKIESIIVNKILKLRIDI